MHNHTYIKYMLSNGKAVPIVKHSTQHNNLSYHAIANHKTQQYDTIHTIRQVIVPATPVMVTRAHDGRQITHYLVFARHGGHSEWIG